MKKLLLLSLAIFALPVFASSQRRHRVELEVNYASNVPHSADFGASVWQKTPSYEFMRAVTHLSDFHALPLEGGQLRLLYDDKYLYAAADVHDSDVTTDGTRNQTHLYAQGDVIEVFLKPENQNYYWEIYGSPNNLTSCFYFPSRGSLGLPSGFADNGVKIKVISAVDGTLNKNRDRDRGWRTLICIPLAELRKNGMKFAPGEKWTIFVARYNYSRTLPYCELSGVPQKFANFHVLSDYARLIIKPGN